MEIRANGGQDQPAAAPVAGLVFKKSPIHGRGGFALRAIAAGTRVIEYVGQKISKAESLRRCESNNACIFALDEAHDLDGNVDWNPARLLNHSCNPNAEARQEGDQIWIHSLRDIGAGEEVTFNYGYDLEDYRQHPCGCGAPDCVGYIVAGEFFEHVRRRQAAARESSGD